MIDSNVKPYWSTSKRFLHLPSNALLRIINITRTCFLCGDPTGAHYQSLPGLMHTVLIQLFSDDNRVSKDVLWYVPLGMVISEALSC